MGVVAVDEVAVDHRVADAVAACSRCCRSSPRSAAPGVHDPIQPVLSPGAAAPVIAPTTRIPDRRRGRQRRKVAATLSLATSGAARILETRDQPCNRAVVAGSDALDRLVVAQQLDRLVEPHQSQRPRTARRPRRRSSSPALSRQDSVDHPPRQKRRCTRDAAPSPSMRLNGVEPWTKGGTSLPRAKSVSLDYPRWSSVCPGGVGNLWGGFRAGWVLSPTLVAAVPTAATM